MKATSLLIIQGPTINKIKPRIKGPAKADSNDISQGDEVNQLSYQLWLFNLFLLHFLIFLESLAIEFLTIPGWSV